MSVLKKKSHIFLHKKTGFSQLPMGPFQKTYFENTKLLKRPFRLDYKRNHQREISISIIKIQLDCSSSDRRSPVIIRYLMFHVNSICEQNLCQRKARYSPLSILNATIKNLLIDP